jgi:indolepyruvate decarboxylase
MMGFELAAAHFHGVNPVVVILDNDGYGTQRLLLDGPFNDIPTLNTERLPDVIGAGKGYLCTSQTEFWQALQAAVADEDFAIIRAKVPKNQSSAALRRLTEALAKKV